MLFSDFKNETMITGMDINLDRRLKIFQEYIEAIRYKLNCID